MGNPTNEENWAARERLRRVEFLLWWRGWVGRQDLVGMFGISSAQASGDLQRYVALNGAAMVYHTSRKRYEAVEGMTCILHEPVFEEAVSSFFGGGATGWIDLGGDADPRLARVELPKRAADGQVARRLMMALLEGRRLRVRYLSLNSGKDEWRELAPVGLGWDGRRWHIRAWCWTRGAWRDFVMGRMLAADWPMPMHEELPVDEDWSTLDTVRLKINPKLSAERRESLRIDYGLEGDTMELKVRRAMKGYLLAEMFIKEGEHRALPAHFVLSDS